jgi:Mn-dependent DtxR family transcriptional regulator
VDEARLTAALSGILGSTLASELSSDLIKIRRDYATRTLERAVSGKFVETFVQCLQYIDTGTFDKKPSVDDYLGKKVENTTLPDGLRVCAARVARAMYTFRNKRNIAHKNDVDINTHDLAFMHQGATWITAELLRNATGISMQEAGALIELVQAPVGTLVEEIGGTKIIHADVSVRAEILILFHSHYPDLVSVNSVLNSLSRRSAGTVRNRLRDLHADKLIHGDVKAGYRLTQSGYAVAVAEIKALCI